MSAALSGNVATARQVTTVDVECLVLDVGLQARLAVNTDVVLDYEEKMRNGAAFPPIEVVRVDGMFFVVDGFHRVAAWKQAHRKVPIPCHVEDGDRLTAIRRAAGANNNHGLQRSNDDKQRAVRMLLRDEDLCKDSSRALAEVVMVSHTFVDNVRKRYGVAKGEVLTAARISAVDGTAPPAWQALLDKAETWEKRSIDEYRVAADVAALAGKGKPYNKLELAAWQLRVDELAVADWPWPSDRTGPAIAARAKSLDTGADLIAALGSRDCPDREQLYKLLHMVPRLKKLESYQLDENRKLFKGRPAFLAEIDVREKKIKANEASRKANDPYEIKRQALESKDPAKQTKLLKQLNKQDLEYLDASRLVPEVRDGVFREMVGGSKGVCPRPGCEGWLNGFSCTTCGQNSKYFETEAMRALTASAALLVHRGFGVRVVDGELDVMLDRYVVDLVAEIGLACAVGNGRKWDDWVRSAPTPQLRQAIQEWLGAEDPKMFAPPKPVEKPVEHDDAGDDLPDEGEE